MKRVVDWLGLLFVSVGAMVGSAWMLGPLHAVKIAGSAAVFSWVLGGVVVMLIALVFAELSAMMPVTGGMARYTQFSHGGIVSFVMTWITWMAYVLIPPVEVQALLQYASNYYPDIVIAAASGTPKLSWIGIFLAVILLSLMSYINILGIKFATEFNKYLVYIKLLVPVLVSVVLLNTSFHFENFNTLTDLSLHDTLKNIVKTLPLAGVIFAYFGFRHSAELGGEAANPQVALPLALIGSIFICMLIYTFVQFTFISTMPPDLLTNGWQAFTFNGHIGAEASSDAGPLVSLASLLGLGLLVKIIFIDAVISPFGSALMVVTTNARLNYAMSINGYFPEFFQKLNKAQVPIMAILTNLVLGLLMLTPFEGWQEMVSLILAALILSHSVAPISLFTLRTQVKDQDRPFKLPFYHIWCRFAFILLTLIAYWTGWAVLSKMYLALAVGLVYLLVFKYEHHLHNESLLNIHKSAWLWNYMVGLALISYLGEKSFGGNGYLYFGLDIIVIVIFSLFIFQWSTRSALTPEQALGQIKREHEISNTEQG